MPVVSRIFLGTPGATQIAHPSISGVRILGVCREGLGYKKGIVTPGNREYVKVGPTIHFNIPFTGDASTSSTSDLREKVFVLYES